MKKCARCGLLNDDTADACSSCVFTVFEEKPAHARAVETLRDPAGSGVTVERHGTMVMLKCRTPAEACLVRENLESGGVIATLPDETEMALQYTQKGYVEVTIPAAAYDSNSDLRSIVEFCAPPPPPPGLGLLGKVAAICLAVMIVPGLLVFVWLLKSYQKDGEERKAKELKLCFLLGLSILLLIIIMSVVTSHYGRF